MLASYNNTDIGFLITVAISFTFGALSNLFIDALDGVNQYSALYADLSSTIFEESTTIGLVDTVDELPARRSATADLISPISEYKFFPGHAVCHASLCHAIDSCFSAFIYGNVVIVWKKYFCSVGLIQYLLLTDVANVVSELIWSCVGSFSSKFHTREIHTLGVLFRVAWAHITPAHHALHSYILPLGMIIKL